MDWATGANKKKPSAARMYDYYLGGAHNFEVDREAAQQLIRAFPPTIPSCRANRAFLQRAVRFMVGEGVHQFLDIGAGIPTVGNVHEIAQAAHPETTTLYVDNESVAVLHGTQLLADNPRAASIEGDLRAPEKLLTQIRETPELHALVDFSKPVGLLLACVLHFLDDSDAHAAAGELIAALAPGSYVVLSHATSHTLVQAGAAKALEIYKKDAGSPVWLRTLTEVERFFTGAELVEPGVVWVHQWRPDGPAAPEFVESPPLVGIYAGVARKP